MYSISVLKKISVNRYCGLKGGIIDGD